MTRADYIVTACACLLVQGNDANEIAGRKLALASAMWGVRTRHGLFAGLDQRGVEFVDMAAMRQHANQLMMNWGVRDFAIEAENRYNIAVTTARALQEAGLL